MRPERRLKPELQHHMDRAEEVLRQVRQVLRIETIEVGAVTAGVALYHLVLGNAVCTLGLRVGQIELDCDVLLFASALADQFRMDAGL